MGAFHCPVGALGYQSQGCIECGLCMANTKAERIAATDKVRQYLRENASARINRKIRKIAICGKGGVGKSTLAALLSMAFTEYGYKVLLIDTDDSNMGLYRKIGAEKQPQQIFDIYATQQPQWTTVDPLAISEIPEEYVENGEGVQIIGIGKIENPFQGCACSSMQLAKNLVLNLDPKEDEIIISDAEAGLESFGRGVEQGCDTIITVVEPSFESIEMASTMQYMAEGLGISRVRCVVSKAIDDEEAEFIIDELSDRDIRYLGVLKTDKTVSRANMLGGSLRNTDSYAEAKELAKLLLDEAEMKY